MMRSVLSTTARGVKRIYEHQELWLVVAFALLLPLLLAVVAYVLLATTRTNLASYEKLLIETVHNTVSAQLSTASPDSTIRLTSALIERDETLQGVSLFVVNNAATTSLFREVVRAGEEIVVDTHAAARFAVGMADTTFIEHTVTLSRRSSYGFRALKVGDAVYLIASAHNYDSYDARIQSRSWLIYAVLLILIVALCTLAYRTAVSVSYKARFEQSRAKERQQSLTASSVVHELRAPLTAIRGYASMIVEATTTKDSVRPQAETILQSAERLIALVSDFLTMSTLEQAKVPELVSVDLVTVAGAVVSELTPLAQEKHLTLAVRARDMSCHIYAEPKMLRQILTNLIGNAIKYTPRGHIEVVLEAQGRMMEVRIKDTGLGMSAEDQARLFAPFTRVGDQTSQAIVGTGLGMWITKLMVERLQGTIGIESIKGVGTHVVVRFKKA
jgi:signal transduction histidine kinase